VVALWNQNNESNATGETENRTITEYGGVGRDKVDKLGRLPVELGQLPIVWPKFEKKI
jgi:hypothetical protein